MGKRARKTHIGVVFKALLSLMNRARPWVLVLYLVYVLVAVFMLTRIDVIAGDSPSIAYVSVGLLRFGTLRLDPFINTDPLFDLSLQPHYVIESQGHYYSKFSPVPSLLTLPIYALNFALFGFPRGPENVIISRYIALSRISATLVVTGVVVAVFMVLRRVLNPSWALCLSFLYAFGTCAWSAATKTLAAQSSAELFMALALLPLLQIEQARQDAVPYVWQNFLLAGLFIALAVAARPQIALVAVILSMYILHLAWKHKVMLGAYGVGAGVIAALLFAYNLWAFASPFSTGYGDEALGGWTTPLWVGLPGMLFSPSHGLLMYSPGLLFAFPGAWAWWQHRKSAVERPAVSSQLGFYLMLAVIVQLLLMSHWWAWHGDVAYNQRMLQEIHPLLMLLVAYGVQRYGQHRTFRYLLAAAAMWGIFMNVARVTFYEQHLTWMEVFHEDLVWSLAYSEPMMYIRWHGGLGFLWGVLLTSVKVGVMVALPTFLLFRFLSRGGGRKPVLSQAKWERE